MAVPSAAAAAAEEAARMKVRKPYTITKSRESWTEPEHDKFPDSSAIVRIRGSRIRDDCLGFSIYHVSVRKYIRFWFDRDWKKIEAFVGSKTVIQIRSHAQKYFLKVQKNGTGEHLPPPRPKRKAAHPYPQKASKSALVASQAVLSQQPPPPPTRDQEGVIMSMDASAVVLPNTNANPVVPSWDNTLVQPTQVPSAVAANNCSSSIESQSGTWPTSEAVEQENVLPPMQAMPDFSQVYNFLGSVFDPDTSGHLQRLKAMDPIDVETVLLLMRNLSMNLINPEFEAHRKLLSSYGSGEDEVKPEGMENLGSQSCHLPSMVTSE